MLIALLLTIVTPRRCIPPIADPLLADIRVSCYISLYPSLPSRMVAMGILTAMMPTFPRLGRSDLHLHRLLLSRAATHLEYPRTLATLPNGHLPVSATLRGLHEPIPRRYPIETTDVKTEIGIVNGAAGSYKSILALLIIRFLALESTLLIAATVLVLVLCATIVHLNDLQGTPISQSQVGNTLPRGLRVNPLCLVLLPLSPSLSLIPLGGMIQGMTAEIPGN